MAETNESWEVMLEAALSMTVPQDHYSQTRFRESFLDRIMAIDGFPVPRGEMQLALIAVDDLWDRTKAKRKESSNEALSLRLRDLGDIAEKHLLADRKYESWPKALVPGLTISGFTFETQPFGLLFAYLVKRIALGIEKDVVFSDAAPRIIVKTLIIPGDKTNDGILVNGVTALWFEMMQMIQADPDSIHQIGCWKWEELLAGAYKQDGWEIVTLTPKRGDHGIDVIAERKGWGQLRFLLLDQMKAYNPGHLIGPDEIREMKGVLMDHPEASKGLITTTADFTPGAIDAAGNLAPRLELRPRDKLVEWLASVAVEKLEGSGLGNAAD